MANTVSAGANVAMGITAAAALALEIAAIAATAVGTGMKIDEGIGDYSQAIADVKARSGDISDEASRRIGTTKEEGILSLKEQGAQAAFEGRMAMTQAEMVASSEEAKLGASGVRAKGSPLLAAQQNVDLAFAAADRTIEKGSAGIALGGLKLGSAMANIGAQETMLTSEYARKQAEMERKKRELKGSRTAMIAISALGGAAGLGSSFYSYGKDLGGWGS